MYSDTRHNRKPEFRAALALAGLTAGEWAALHGVSRFHVHAVVTGTRVSERLSQIIDAFIAQHVRRAA